MTYAHTIGPGSEDMSEIGCSDSISQIGYKPKRAKLEDHCFISPKKINHIPIGTIINEAKKASAGGPSITFLAKFESMMP